MKAHTPGPWEVGYSNNQAPVVTAGEHDIATVDTSRGDSEANARLIAAAPDLLKAAQNMSYLLWNNEQEELADDLLDAAIAKALGEPAFWTAE